MDCPRCGSALEESEPTHRWEQHFECRQCCLAFELVMERHAATIRRRGLSGTRHHYSRDARGTDGMLEALPRAGEAVRVPPSIGTTVLLFRAGSPSYPRRGGASMNGWKTTRLTNSDLIFKIALLVLGFAAAMAGLIYNSYISHPRPY